jgi:hypothetical protein
MDDEVLKTAKSPRFAVLVDIGNMPDNIMCSGAQCVIVIHDNIETMAISTDSNFGYISCRYDSRPLPVQSRLGV